MAFSTGKLLSAIVGLLLLFLSSSEATGLASAGFIKTNGVYFWVDGSPFLFNGFNSYWMMSVGADPNQRNKISSVFSDASAAGLTVCRLWAFSDAGYNALQTSPGVYDENVFQSLDFVISEAKKYGVRLILSLVNNWNDYGGKHQYIEWAKTADGGIKNDDEFFTNQVVKSYYKDHVKKILTRKNTILDVLYKDDATIMAWELMNEPRSDDASTKIINDWAQEMATYVKSIDNNHLLTVGLEGFYGEAEKKKNPYAQIYGTDFIANHQIKEIDFTTIHAYPSAWMSNERYVTQFQFLANWIVDHWQDSTNIVKKPLIFSEFGMSNKNATCKPCARNFFLKMNYMHVYKLARRGGSMSGGLVWQVMAEDMDSWDDGHSIVLSRDHSTARIMKRQARKMLFLSKKIKKRHW